MTQGTENKSTIEEKFALVKGRPYASAVDEQSYDREGILTVDEQSYDREGILTADSKAFNCIGLISYLFDVKAAYSVANFDQYTQFRKLTGITSAADLQINDIIRW